MKALILFTFLFGIIFPAEAQQNEDKDVRVVFTNSLCPPCAVEYPIDADSIRSRRGSLAGLTINTNFPYPADLLYQANAANNDEMVGSFMVTAVPLRIARFAPLVGGQRRWPIALSTRLHSYGTAPNDSLLITCTATIRDNMDADMFRRLYVAVAEQDYTYSASPSNGVSYYANVCRWQKSWAIDSILTAGQTIVHSEKIPRSRIATTSNRLQVVAFGYNLLLDNFFAGSSDTLSPLVTALRPVQNPLHLWPNPVTTGTIHIDGLTRPTPYELLDGLGRRIGSGTTAGTLSLTEKPAGLYVVRIAGQAHRIELR